MKVSVAQVRRFLQRSLPDVGVRTIEPIPTGHFNASFRVAARCGPDLVVRVAPAADDEFLFYERRMMRQEPVLHELLRQRTRVPVPEVLAYEEDAAELGRSVLVLECLQGVPLTEAAAADRDRVLGQVGAMLRQVHALTGSQGYGYVGPHRPMRPEPEWFPAFRRMWDLLLTDIERVGCYDRREREELSRLLLRHEPTFAARGAVPASLLHMDVWDQNILVRPEDSLVTGLIDWDRALWGDPEIEFAVLDYCGVSTPAFWAGYGAERDTGPEARVRRLFYLLYELQKYMVIYAGRYGDTERAQRYRDQSLQLAASLGFGDGRAG
jgi:aminoglycoside phosphotransferase (APT) family kinase protein